MKKLLLTLALVGFAGLTTAARAAETMGEKATDSMHDAGRSMKKGAHHTEEAMCQKGAKCEKEKAKHRVEEGTDAVKDKATEMKNKAD